MIEHILIVGAGRTTHSLVQRLASIAPITVLDRSREALAELQAAPAAPAGEAAVSGRGGPLRQARFPVTIVEGDGGSRLVLQDLRGPQSCALVVAAGSDRQNLEICRLGAELGFKPVVPIVISAETAQEYRDLGARPIVRASLLGDLVEQTLRHDGIAMATNVGLGKGDLIEIRILSSSPAIGQRLADLRADRWRVAAIYRDDQLVIPTGTTRIAVDDRVLLVGDPAILPHVGDNLRQGVPDFPLRFGSSVVVYLPGGRDRELEGPAEVLALRTCATRLVRLTTGGEASRTEIIAPDEGAEAPAPERNGAGSKYFEERPLEGASLEDHVRSILLHQPGVIVARSRRRSLVERALGWAGADAELCNLASVPVLFPGARPHLDRVVLLLDPTLEDLRAIDSAIDLSRLLKLSLALLRVELPGYLGGLGREDELAQSIQRRAGLYGLRAAIERRIGNPIAQAVAFVEPGDLCVVARRRGSRDSFVSPDAALRIAHAAPCSTLVFTVDGDR